MTAFLELIQNQTVGSTPVSTITFSNIPQTYKDLVLHISSRTNRTGGTADGNFIRLNGDATALYSRTYLDFYSSASAGRETGYGSWNFDSTAQDIAIFPAGTFGNTWVTIPEYANSSQWKTGISDYVLGTSSTGSVYMGLSGGLYRSNNAITSIVLGSVQGYSFTQYSSFTLYGTKV